MWGKVITGENIYLCWCVQGIDVFTPNVVEFDSGVPDWGRRGRVRWEKAPLHPCHCKQVPLGAPLHDHVYRTTNKDVRRTASGFGRGKSATHLWDQYEWGWARGRHSCSWGWCLQRWSPLSAMVSGCALRGFKKRFKKKKPRQWSRPIML